MCTSKSEITGQLRNFIRSDTPAYPQHDLFSAQNVCRMRHGECRVQVIRATVQDEPFALDNLLLLSAVGEEGYMEVGVPLARRFPLTTA